MDLPQQQIINILGLKPHPTCGLVKEAFVSKHQLSENCLPKGFQGPHPTGQALYFMVTPTTQIKLHKILSDQMYHYYYGSPLEVLLLYPDGNFEIKMAGMDLQNGMTPQIFIPANTFHMGRLFYRDGFSLLGTSEWIGVLPQDVELGDPGVLITEYPEAESAIREFAGMR